ncbi:hypothetical protein PORCRE_1354 [Porphyromonas crevioricanis JCM 15906]|uniref:Uncharacterized protein n=1 Tax=Porphyromonas crevioricanis JCM 15906 TaxID=1305617 RepID=T1DT76_9PORP|nr:hypothetical protein PORCRE_1354 [Porphyromonas crevioricanis JCM 15906]GAD06534.1 hypothetical protein PORCAN_130 [Porphyromonas crevioricanis JCM 13913]
MADTANKFSPTSFFLSIRITFKPKDFLFDSSKPSKDRVKYILGFGVYPVWG